ncbi:MAG: VOC family protein [Eubacteriales bacterium]|nr:VOC family protein [Eubacteriales bacterium]
MTNPNYIKGTHHINLRPCGEKAYEETVAFYTQTLGMPVVRSWGEGEKRGCMIDTGDSVMELNCAQQAADSGTPAVNHFALATDHVDEVTELVRRAGYAITVEPMDACLPCEKLYPIRIAFCRGPVGESIEFFMEK